ncbi:hypothetical protein ACT6QH_11320 [Xanthobacter sp. TB0139]|uniref:hypothetical protein n=1 Tax=Xanthobacter sp. TB0139 TaxID=3459178 RepID=UPI00403A2983
MNQTSTKRTRGPTTAIALNGKTPQAHPESRRRPIRAFRSEDAQQLIAQRTDMLHHFRMDPNALARALRASRKAARHRTQHYDPARHAALLRLARQQHGTALQTWLKT